MASEDESDDDTYVTIGTAFPPLETDQDIVKAKEKKDKDFYVLDQQGRRRFHGAFTGGFSAGYFNTVGSKEGWAPASFTSSRSKKANYSKTRPEEFMDDEDLSTFGIAPREVATREEYQQEGREKPGAKRAHPPSHPSAIPGEPPLQNLIVPARFSAGTRLLQAMGWKEGQGVGPRVLKYPSGGSCKVYSCAPPSMGSNGRKEAAVDPRAEGFMFAPQDTAPWKYSGKDNMHGIGYRGIQESEVLGGTSLSKAVHGMSGHAFGVGALEEDDDDIYSQETLASFNLTEANENELSSERAFGWTGGMEGDSWGLHCFLRSVPSVPSRKYAPPQVPRAFVAVHKFSVAASPSTGVLGPPLSSAQRGSLILDGGEVKSVFDLIPATDRERLKIASEAARDPSAWREKEKKREEEEQVHKKQKEQERHRKLEQEREEERAQPSKWDRRAAAKAEAITAGTYKPFSSNPSKQMRYEAFLKGKKKFMGSDYEQLTEWERRKEKEEFARTARLFQPLSTSLSEKFTSGTSETEDGHSLGTSDAVNAAKMDMFGVMTREVLLWYPHKVLCKRFNIPDPYPHSSVVGVPPPEANRGGHSVFKPMHFERSAQQESRMDHLKSPVAAVGLTSAVTTASSEVETTLSETDTTESRPVHEVSPPQSGSTKQDDEVQVMQEDVRPPMEMFRSIFAESSSDSEIDDNTGEHYALTTSSSITDTSPILQNKQQVPDPVPFQTKPPMGNKWQNFASFSVPLPVPPPILPPPAHSVCHEDQQTSFSSRLPPPEKENPPLKEVFGPALPPPPVLPSGKHSHNNDTSSEAPSDHKLRHHSSHHKKDHKHKEKDRHHHSHKSKRRTKH